jgi:hypothetical protein
LPFSVPESAFSLSPQDGARKTAAAEKARRRRVENEAGIAIGERRGAISTSPENGAKARVIGGTAVQETSLLRT